MKKIYLKLFFIFLIILFKPNNLLAEIIKDIQINGNQRISKQTIILFSKAKINSNVSEEDLNFYLKNLYETDFFKDVSVKLDRNILIINVKEEPIIQSVIYKGIKAKKIIDPIKNITKLRDRSSFKEYIFLEDKEKIQKQLRSMGYYFSDISGSIETLGDNKINLIYDINLGQKAKISKITFTGDKVYKDKKLRSIIASEEYKFWKFISGRKFLNEQIIELDKRLLKNFYLNNGFYKSKINTSFAKLIGDNNFELIFNVSANEKFYFNDIKLNISKDYSKDNFSKIFSFFKKIKGQPYSINTIDNIVKLIDEVLKQLQLE